jgi:hypothetical protein
MFFDGIGEVSRLWHFDIFVSLSTHHLRGGLLTFRASGTPRSPGTIPA